MKTKLALFAILLLSSLSGCASTIPLIEEQKQLDTVSVENDTLMVCSFNIQFLGHFKERNDSLLTDFVEGYDIVVIQEMVAPPVDGKYPDGSPFSADPESNRFHSLMLDKGFDFWCSEEDTGPTKNHVSSSASEWWVMYYNNKLVPDTVDEPYGFLSDTLVANSKFQRVPYSFALKTKDGRNTFNLISVHLNPGGSSGDKAIRAVEFNGIAEWIQSNSVKNKDFIVLGDCNIEDKDELKAISQNVFNNRYRSLNDNCASTNTKFYESKSKGKPYDHIFINGAFEEDILIESFTIADYESFLMSVNRREEFFPYDHNYFRTRLSDHFPISFKIVTGRDSD